MGITRRFKSYFFRGLAILLPTILTIWIFIWGYTFIQGNISVHINRGLVRLIMHLRDYHDDGAREALNRFWIEGPGSIAGFVVAVIAVCIVGAMLASVVGKSLWRMVERFIMRAPFLRQVYPYVKQITDFLFKEQEQKRMFSRVVAIEYPRKGIWSIGLVTGTGLKKIIDNVEKEFVTIFIPSSPTPFTGYVIMVPKEQTIDLDITIEEALRFSVSGGVIAPGSKQAALLEADLEKTKE